MSSMKRILAMLLAVQMVLFGLPVMAQTAGPNGGMMVAKDGHETELIVSPSELTVYLHASGKPEGVNGAKLRAVIQEAGKNSTTTFAIEGQKLVAKLAAPLAKGAVVVITGTDSDGHVISSRYVIR